MMQQYRHTSYTIFQHPQVHMSQEKTIPHQGVTTVFTTSGDLALLHFVHCPGGSRLYTITVYRHESRQQVKMKASSQWSKCSRAYSLVSAEISTSQIHTPPKTPLTSPNDAPFPCHHFLFCPVTPSSHHESTVQRKKFSYCWF